jgi:PST family polysaccharide transporter
MKLRLKAFQSGALLSITTVGIRALRFGALIVLARLLQPADFGLLALALVAVTGLTIISNLGLFSALVASKQEKYKAAHHVFVMNSGAGVCLSLLLVFGAGPYSQIYGEPVLQPICQMMALIVLFDSLKIAPDALLIKDMMLGRHVGSMVIGAVAGAAVSIVLAVLGAGVWSLVVGAVTTSLMTLVSLMIACPNMRWLYQQTWENAIAKQLLGFGTRSMTATVISYYCDSIDRLLVGKLFGSTQLGFYQQGFNFANLPILAVTDITHKVLLPAYSQISDDKQRLARAFLSSFQMVSVLTIPMAVGILVLAPEAIVVLLGDKWRETAAVIQVLALISLVRPLSRTTSALFLSLGFPQYNLLTALTQAVCMTLFILPALRWGIVGVASAVAFAVVVGLVQNMYLVCKKTGLPLKFQDIERSVRPILWSGFLMCLSLVAIKVMLYYYSVNTYNLSFLFICSVIGVLIYQSVTGEPTSFKILP